MVTVRDPLQAYQDVMLFARRSERDALLLAMHLAVPEGFRADLAHLMRLNFLPNSRHLAEAELLLSTICQDAGGGYYRFHREIRRVLLNGLVDTYRDEERHRLGPRLVRVAQFLLYYVERLERSNFGKQDSLLMDYLDVQRWVALSFINPRDAARQLAEAVSESEKREEYAARINIGGLASVLSTPLTLHDKLLAYIAGLQALEAGQQTEAQRLFDALGDEEMDIEGIRLTPPGMVLDEWRKRNPQFAGEEISPPSVTVEAAAATAQATGSDGTPTLEREWRAAVLEATRDDVASINLCAEPSIYGAILWQIVPGTQVAYNPQWESAWTQIRFKNMTGWVNLDLAGYYLRDIEAPSVAALTPYDGKIAVWHWKGDSIPEKTIEDAVRSILAGAPNVSQVWVKVSDGNRWQGEFDSNRMTAIDGPESIDRWVKVLESYGMEFHAWCVPKGADIEAEADLIIQTCSRPGVRSLVMDIEPFNDFWQGGSSAIRPFMARIRGALPSSFHIGMAVDPRKQHAGKIFPQEWFPFVNSVHPMVYWTTFQRTPADVLKEAFDIWGDYGRPLVPILPGDTSPADMNTAISLATRQYQVRGLSVWRLGTIQRDTWNIINSAFSQQPVQEMEYGQTSAAPPPEPPPPTRPTGHVFICYAHSDSDFVRLLTSRLEETGLKFWFDNQLVPGQDWATQIDTAIEEASVAVLVISAQASASAFVTYDWAYAMGVGVPIIPIMLNPMERLHPSLAKLQYFDFTNIDQHPWDILIHEVKSRVEQHDPRIVRRRQVPGKHVFISYRHDEVSRFFLDVLQLRLERAGYEWWRDDEKLSGGTNWESAINDAIENAQMMIVIMTPDALASQYVTFEWAYALGVGVPVIPIMLKPVEALHIKLANLQYLDFTDASNPPWDRLLQALEENKKYYAQKAGSASDNQQVSELVAFGEDQYRNGDYSGAIAAYRRALELAPTNPNTLYLISAVYVRIRQLDEAQELLERALQFEPNFAPALAELGYVYRRIADRLPPGIDQASMLNRSESYLLQALQISPDLLDIDGESWWGALGGLYRRSGQVNEAIQAYEQAAKVTPQSSYPYNNLGLLYQQLKNSEAMISNFQQGERLAQREVDIDTDDYWTWGDLVVARLALGKTDGLEVTFENYRTSVGGNLDAMRALLETLERLIEVADQEKREAIQDYIARLKQKLDEDV